MSKHDPFCYQFVEHAGMPSDCFCDPIASVRVDERASAYPGREIRSQLLEALQKVDALNDQLAVARAEVAAHEAAASNMLTAWRNTRAERDAALAELAEIDARIYGAAGIHRRNYAAERDLRLVCAEVAALRGALNVAIRLLSDVGITCTVDSLIEEAQHG